MDFNSLLIAVPTLVTGLALTEILRRRRRALKPARAVAERKPKKTQRSEQAE